jgi:protein phosphatase
MTDSSINGLTPPESSSEELEATVPLPQLASVAPPLHLAVSALTDVGCVRTNNEDCLGFDETSGIYVVCDGMGGMASGEVASSFAVEAMVRDFTSTAGSDDPVSSRLLHAINAANMHVWESAQTPENRGMGTTAVVAAQDGSKVVIGNVGDSRAYVIHNGRCTQLTIDHSYINELIRTGAVAVENVDSVDLQGMESVICRAIGVAPEVQPDFFSVDLEPGVTILLVSDGLYRYLLQDEIAAIIRTSTFESACAQLIDVAKQRGGVDNITCLLLVAQV